MARKEVLPKKKTLPPIMIDRSKARNRPPEISADPRVRAIESAARDKRTLADLTPKQMEAARRLAVRRSGYTLEDVIGPGMPEDIKKRRRPSTGIPQEPPPRPKRNR
jgi:hypothetical protein